MADIDVVKKGSRMWLWILLAVAFLIILWMVIGAGDRPQTSGRLIEDGRQMAQTGLGGGERV